MATTLVASADVFCPGNEVDMNNEASNPSAVTFVDGGPPPGGGIVIGHQDCLVYVVMDGNLVDILHDPRAVWVPSPTRTMRADAKRRLSLRDQIRATYRL